MPKRKGKKRLILTLMSLLAFFFIKCINGNQKTAFPISESEYSLPVEKPLKFGDTSIIKWKITAQDSIKPLPEIKFDLAKIPSKPFDFGVDIPFVQELKEKSFDLDKIQDTIFDFRKLPTYSLLFRTSILERPKTTKARYPTVKIGAARGVMEIGKEMGLNGVGRCFLQDKNGQIWIGTDKGLWRYDGENFESYSIVTEYNIDNITSLVEDDQEGMWVGTNSGRLFQLEIKKGLIHEVKDTLPISAIYSMMKDQAGRIWVAVSGFGIRIIDIKEKTIKQFTNKEGLVQNLNTKMMQDHQGGIWITSTSGVNLIDTKKHLNKRISQKNGLNNPAAFSLLEDRNHQIWIGGTNGVDIINRQKRTLLHLAKAQGLDSITFIPGLYQDQVGKVWVGTDKGIVFKVDVEKQVFEKIKVNPGVQNIIYQFSEDKNKQLWIGSIQGGCYLINPNNGRPGNFTESNGLGGENIWSIQEDKQGNLWVGTYTGIDIINRANKTIKHIDHNNGLLQDRASQLYIDKKGRIWANAGQFGCNIIDLERGVIQHLTKAQGLPFNQCGTFFEDKNGFMWIGSQGGKICRLNLPNKLIMRIENSPESSSNPINTIIEDANEQLWLTKQVGGVLVIDKSRKTIKPLSAQQGILSSETTTVFEDQNKNIWIATEKGVEQLDVSNKTISSFTVKEGLSSNGVYTIDEFNGQIILGSSTGFNFLSKTPGSKTKEWKIFSLDYQQGLIALDVAQNSTFISKEGQIWAGVEDQILTVIDYPKTDTIVNHPFITGINILDKPQMFGDKQYFELAIKNIDTIWKAEKDSFYRNKADLVAHYFPQKNKLTWDSTPGPYFLPVNLQLPIDQNFLSFTFTGTNLANADKTKYRYILEGIDKKWSPITENAVSENYRDLPAGYYTFRVASKSMNGIWSKPAEFSFTILPPWWQTWWAYLIYLLFFIGILRAYIVFRSRSLQRENQVLDEKITLRTQQLQKTIEDLKTTQNQLVLSEKMASLGELTAGIAHEIQNPLNFINNFSEVNAELIDEMEEELSKGNLEEVSAIAKDIKGNEEKITFHGKRADNIVKGMLQHSRASTGKKEATDINALADEYLRLAYHGLRAKDKSFNATMKTDFDETIGNVQVISQDIGRVILNLITNAFYAVTDKKKKVIDGFEPTVWVSTKKVGNKVEIRVKDNGMGVPSKVIEKIFQPFFSTKPTGEGTGLGLSMSYDIVTKGHEGELIVNTQEGEYAEFVILLPILQF